MSEKQLTCISERWWLSDPHLKVKQFR
ncbi:hypothetical protein CEXT_37161, partial [Caerostris extrusa]